MELASEADTLRFLQTIWYSWGTCIVREIAAAYNLSPEQTEALETVLLKPNDWQINSKET
jgi:hypothetical protein